jgi:hypothetical protein
VNRILLAAMLAAVPLRAEAQKFSFAPQIGFYIPTEQLVQGIQGQPFDAAELEAGPSFGARLGFWFGDRFGIDVSGNYVPTTFRLVNEGSEITSEDAKLFNGAAQAVLFILPRTGTFSLYINGGVGVVSRGGVAFTDAADKSDVAGVFGGGAAIRLGGLALSVGADLFAYTAKIEQGVTTESSFKQKDVQLKLGLGIPFGGSQIKR